MIPSAAVEVFPAVHPPYVGRASNLSAGRDKLPGADREVGGSRAIQCGLGLRYRSVMDEFRCDRYSSSLAYTL